MPVVGPIVVLFVVFLYSGNQVTDEEQEPYADQKYICNFELHQSYGKSFARVKLIKAPPFPTRLTVQRRFLCCSSS